MPADRAHRDRWRRYWDKHSASYDKQIRFFDRVLFSDSRAWVCSQATGDPWRWPSAPASACRFTPPEPG